MALLSKLSKKEKTILYVVIIVVSLAVLDHFMLKPTLERLDTLDEKIDLLRDDLRRDKEVLYNKDLIQSEYKNREAYMKVELTEAGQEAKLKEEIDRLAKASGVILEETSSLATVKKENYIKYVDKVECNGKREQVTRFLYALTDHDSMILLIEKIEIRPEKPQSDTFECSITVSNIAVIP